ncbi:hypothetical protein LWC34_49215 [Kibdelosporangium philippinense]|uniref:DUF2613 domain-containing protein n=1 Tax=Kibdelosporangium philippinense TaxID=211113 RepID=A0ABS8ZSM7_9PSEU|nr:hypothetical protein [Kibdelosporangium philippinense]MCE7010733.1 hypothetical protein [Kibdelosporangium philippinense]
MGTLIAVVIVVVAGLGLAGGGTYVLVDRSQPDEKVDFAKPANNTGNIVNYGSR